MGNMGHKQKYRIIAGIPAYNEDKYIEKVVVNTLKFVDLVVVVDDGSTDETSLRALRAGAMVIRHKYNRGYGEAIKTIFKLAKLIDADILITLDADMQHNPNEIPKLIRLILNNEADIVVGSRFLGTAEQPLWRKLGVKILTLTFKYGMKVNSDIKNITDVQSGFRAYNRKSIHIIHPYDSDMGVSIEILYHALINGLRIKEVPITIKHHSDSNSQNPLKHGFKILVKTLIFIIRHRLMEM